MCTSYEDNQGQQLTLGSGEESDAHVSLLHFLEDCPRGGEVVVHVKQKTVGAGGAVLCCAVLVG
ncbi:hypothetical protein TK78_24855 [Streptomyces sp. Tue 6075]|nr:hypothetical protein TK78_24855 [Streptomyces sp. Tue 6075]